MKVNNEIRKNIEEITNEFYISTGILVEIFIKSLQEIKTNKKKNIAFICSDEYTKVSLETLYERYDVLKKYINNLLKGEQK